MARRGASGQYITADGANVAAMNAPFTVAAWLNAPAANTNNTYYGEGSSSTANPMLQCQINTGKARFFLRSDLNGGTAEVNGVTTTATVADSTWHHVIFTQDGSGNYQVYVDGIADISGSYSTGALTADRVTFGALRRNGTPANYYGGTIADIATWGRKLSASEAKNLGSGLPASHLGPNHYWPLWGVDSPEPDIGNG